MPRPPWIAILLLLSGAGCASSGPRVPAVPVYAEPWSGQGAAGSKLVTEHYVVYTTLEDRELAESVARLMESALAQYSKLAPAVPLCVGRVVWYLFPSRDPLAAFTQIR